MPFLASTKPLFTQLKILNVFDLYKLRLAIFMFSCQRQILPLSLTRYVSINSSIHSHCTRSNADFHIPYARTSVSQKTIYYAGPKLWNALPPYLKSAPSLNVFKRQYKERLLQSYPH